MHEKCKPSALCRAQVADNLPLYGVCCYMEEIVHRPPTVLRGGRAPSAPLSRYMVSAPRCYCFLTHQPFFSLHFKVSRLKMPSGTRAGRAENALCTPARWAEKRISAQRLGVL